MEEMRITYEWLLSTCVLNKNGKKYLKHMVTALGDNYKDARFYAAYFLEKRKWTLLAVNEVKHICIASARYSGSGKPVPVSILKTVPCPTIPAELNPYVAPIPALHKVYDQYEKPVTFYNIEDKIKEVQDARDFKWPDPEMQAVHDQMVHYYDHLLQRLITYKEQKKL